MPNTKPITTNEAAKMFGYNPAYIRELLRTGKVKGQQIGQTWVVNVPSLRAYIRTHGYRADNRLSKF